MDILDSLQINVFVLAACVDPPPSLPPSLPPFHRETNAAQWPCILCEPQEQDDTVGGPTEVNGRPASPPSWLGDEVHRAGGEVLCGPQHQDYHLPRSVGTQTLSLACRAFFPSRPLSVSVCVCVHVCVCACACVFSNLSTFSSCLQPKRGLLIGPIY